MRRVVLLCGPPGAGKTTAAIEGAVKHRLTVYDRDDARWASEREFVAALRKVGYDRDAQAVVIRSAASSSARKKAARLVDATEVYLITGDMRELERRVADRGRDVRREIAGLHGWFNRFDHGDGVTEFPGWDNITAGQDVVVRSW